MIGLVLAAAGEGSRFGADIPKQFTEAKRKPLYLHSLESFRDLYEQAVIVVPESWQSRIEDQIRSLPYRKKLLIEIGGPQRQDSVSRGLRRLAAGIEIVLVHDAARPFPSRELISRVIEQTRCHHACIPAVPVRDTIKEVRGGWVLRTLERDHLMLVQTPQGFETSLLRKAFEQAAKDGFHGTDEASLVERLSVPIHVVPGEASNIKITWKEDWGNP